MTGQQCDPDCSRSQLATGWALHALEPAEDLLVTAHLLDCSECARTVAQTELVGAVLGLSVPEAIPSAELEQRVLAVTTTAQALSMLPLTPLAANGTGRALRTPAVSPLPQVPHRRRGREPDCWPETLVLISVALLVFTFTFAILFYVIP